MPEVPVSGDAEPRVRDSRDSDALYLLFLGRRAQDDEARAAHCRRPALEIAEEVIASAEFGEAVLGRLLADGTLPHDARCAADLRLAAAVAGETALAAVALSDFGPDIHFAIDLDPLEDAAFVAGAYRMIVNREAAPAEIETRLEWLRAGIASKRGIAEELLASQALEKTGRAVRVIWDERRDAADGPPAGNAILPFGWRSLLHRVFAQGPAARFLGERHGAAGERFVAALDPNPPRLRLRLGAPHPAGGLGEYPPGARLLVEGWALARDGIATIEIAVAGRRIKTARCGLPRPEVAAACPDWPEAERSGFAAVLPFWELPAEARAAQIILRDGTGGTATAELFLAAAEPDRPPAIGPYERAVLRRILAGLDRRPLFCPMLVIDGDEGGIAAARASLDALRRQSCPDWRAVVLVRDDGTMSARLRERLLSGAGDLADLRDLVVAGSADLARLRADLLDGFEEITKQIELTAGGGPAALADLMRRRAAGRPGFALPLTAGAALAPDALLELAVAGGIEGECDLISSGAGEEELELACLGPDVLRRAGARLDDLLQFGPRTVTEYCAVEASAATRVPFRLSAPGEQSRTVRAGAEAERDTDGEGCGPAALDYEEWCRLYDPSSAADREAIGAHLAGFSWRPRISLAMPAGDASPELLRRTIESVRRQLYPDWELQVGRERKAAGAVCRVLDELAAADPRVRIVELPDGAAEANCALAAADGEFVAWIGAEDELAATALYLIVAELNRHPEADILYSDEDRIGPTGERREPHFKPDWNPDLFYGWDYVGGLRVFRAARAREAGGARGGFAGAFCYDLMLRVIERTEASRIRHIPFVLYHRRAGDALPAGASEASGSAAARRALGQHFLRTGRRGVAVVAGRRPDHHRVVWPLPNPPPRVSLLVPTGGGRLDLLDACVSGLLDRTDYADLELIILDNTQGQDEALAYFARIAADPRVTIVDARGPFNFSRICNIGVARARGEIIGLVNDDIEVIEPGWLREMASQALRPEVGAVGAMLYYPDETIQHAGMVLGLRDGAEHIQRRLPRGAPGYFGRAVLAQDLSCVTAACLATRRAVYREVGGLDETFAVDFNDVDFCLKLRNKGYRIVWTPFAELYHLESATRGHPDTLAKLRRLRAETRHIQEKWGSRIFGDDPCFNPNLRRDAEDYEIGAPRVAKPWRAALLT